MKDFIVYNESGKILRVGKCPDEFFEIQAMQGEFLLEGVADVDTNIVLNGQVEQAPIVQPEIIIKTLAELKIEKIQNIARAYITANITSFTYNGKEYAANQNAQNNLTGISGYVAQNNALPPSFPNVWQAFDGSIIGIMNVQDFKNLYAAFVDQGNVNFIRYAMLEAQVNAATSKEQLEGIVW